MGYWSNESRNLASPYGSPRALKDDRRPVENTHPDQACIPLRLAESTESWRRCIVPAQNVPATCIPLRLAESTESRVRPRSCASACWTCIPLRLAESTESSARAARNSGSSWAALHPPTARREH